MTDLGGHGGDIDCPTATAAGTEPDPPRPGLRPGRVVFGLVRGTRPEQWCKNLLVVVLPVTAGRFTTSSIAGIAVAFAAFTLAAGGTYLLNDVVDRQADAAHPRKRHRPVASGLVPAPTAVVAGVLLVIGAFALPLGTGRTQLTVVIAGYLVLSGLYNAGAKHVAHLELALVASFFALRTVGGAAATGVPVDLLLVTAIACTAMALVAGKRLAELRDHRGSSTRRVLDDYSLPYLDAVRIVAAGAAVVAYGGWAVDAARRSGDVLFMASIVPVVVGFCRYSALVSGGRGERPERIVWADRPLLASILLAATAVGLGAPALS